MGKPTGEKRLRIVGQGWVYYGDVRLPLRLVGGALEFRVKETWLRAEYGECVEIPIWRFLSLAAELALEKSSQTDKTMIP